MTGRLAVLASRYAGRPLLMLPRAAQDLAVRLHEIDAQAFERPGRLQAILRKLSGARPAPMAMEDDEDYTPVPFHERAAYTPLYAGDPEDLGFCWALKDGVAMMQVDTPLTDRGELYCGTVYHGYDTVLAGLRAADADDRVKAKFIRMSSPGGPVAGGLPELAAYMRANRELAGGKPIHVFADMACSAAYWISAQADRVLAPRVGLVGSIGAVIVHEDWSAGLEKAGLKITPIQFGADKTMGAWWEALSPRAQAALQSEIDQCGRDFVADVASGRAKLTPEALLATEAGVFMANHDNSGESGLELGFVDAIMGEEAAFRALADQVSSPQALGIPQPAAPGGRAAGQTTKDTPMAVSAETTARRQAALTASTAALAVAQRAATLAQANMDKEDDEDLKDGGDDEAAEGEAPGEDAAEPQDTKKKPESEAIAASAEAKSHPALALAAIQTGQTLAQFQASVKAAGAGKGALAATLGASPRLGADGAAPAASGARSAAQIYAANSPSAGKK